jgi:hypothetical protein
MDIDPTFAVAWGTRTLVDAGVAQGTGRGGLGWLAASLLLGPIAMSSVVVVPPVSRPTPPV